MKIKTSFKQYWLALTMICYLLMTSCTPPGPPCGDLVVSAIRILSLTPDVADYEIDFMNVNVGPITLFPSIYPNPPYALYTTQTQHFISYFSKDAFLSSDDYLAMDCPIATGVPTTLLGGDKVTKRVHFDMAMPYYDNYPRSVNTTNYPYFIVTFYGPETCTQITSSTCNDFGPIANDCNLNNNVYAFDTRTNTGSFYQRKLRVNLKLTKHLNDNN